MTESPFQSPERPDINERNLDFGDYQVVGRYLVCGSEVLLPQYCVISGDEDDLVNVDDTLIYVSLWNRILHALAVVVLLPILAIPGSRFLLISMFQPERRDCCRISYCLAQRYVSRHRWKLAIGALLFIGAVAFFLWSIQQIPTKGKGVIAMPLTLVISLFVVSWFVPMQAKPLRLKSLRQGCFWISGLREPFIRRLEEGSD
ncbi:MAG: hypothetical protein U0996_23780 [Planctomycetaceae bacterium]